MSILRVMEEIGSRVQEELSQLDPTICFVTQKPNEPRGCVRVFVPDNNPVELAMVDESRDILAVIENFAPSREIWISPTERLEDGSFTFVVMWPLATETGIKHKNP